MGISQIKARGIALGAAIVLCGLLAACASRTVAGSPTEGGITVTASGRVEVVPDVASISVGIITTGDTAAAAQKDHAAPVNAMLDTLRELGIDEKDIQTTSSGVMPVWQEEGEETTSYEAHTVLAVDNVAIDEIPSVMEACLDAGATEVDGPEYSTAAYEDSYQEALAKAVEAARPKAEAIAAASGVRLGGIVAVSEGPEDRTYALDEAAADAAGTKEEGMEIAPGEVAVEAQATVTFAIR